MNSFEALWLIHLSNKNKYVVRWFAFDIKPVLATPEVLVFPHTKQAGFLYPGFRASNRICLALASVT